MTIPAKQTNAFFIFQGLEFDWEWPLSTGDKKDKIKLIRYMRVSLFNGFIITWILHQIIIYSIEVKLVAG